MTKKRTEDWNHRARVLGFGSIKGLLVCFYILRRMSVETIAKLLHVNPRRVFQLLKKYGVKRHDV